MKTSGEKAYSIVIPAYNEEGAMDKMLKELLAQKLNRTIEVVVVNDCSTDKTAKEVAKHPVVLLNNIQNWGYGYSLKEGIKAATHENIIITDADGTYPISSISKLIAEYEKGYDMVVGARQGKFYQGTFFKKIARHFFRLLSEYATGRRIPDINSGLRVFRKDLTMQFFHTLSSGFSFTTTITLAFMLNFYNVHYFPIEYHRRDGSSKVRYLRDTLRSLQIITEAIVYYNPLKIFLLCIVLMLFTGFISLLIGYLFSVWLATILFLTVSFATILFAIGCAVVFLKFTHTHD